MTPVHRAAVPLLWIERTLAVAAAGLAVWCSLVFLQMHQASNLPIADAAERLLPGEGLEQVARGLEEDRAPAAGTWLARLEAPGLSLATTVLEGTDDRTLRRAAGHIAHTALPGSRGNVGVAGHRDTVFRALRDIQIGDALVLTTSDEILRYRVASATVVDPYDVYVLDPTPGPVLTLVTCYPFTFFGSAPRRFVVRAELVDLAPRR
jgi:sortase A